jgi:hypothetical protein
MSRAERSLDPFEAVAAQLIETTPRRRRSGGPETASAIKRERV